jgi:hypothetical protein
MRRPNHKHSPRHKKTPPPPGIDLAILATEVRYVGSPEHKSGPSFAGRPSPRADASICDPALNGQRDLVESWLRESLGQGNYFGPWEGKFPR